MKFKKYDKSFEYSYCFGQFPSIELIKSKKTEIVAIICHEKLKINEEIKKILDFAKKENIEIIHSTKQVEALSNKDNCYLITVFKKFKSQLTNDNHIVLVSPSDSGNLGTIIRTTLGLDITNLAIIENGKNTTNQIELNKSNTSLDIFNPKVIRASMGSIFNVNIQVFNNFEDYKKSTNNSLFAFYLDGAKYLSKVKQIKQPFSLIFGNEATGLPEEICDVCEKIKIEQSNKIDSYNLAVSVAIGTYQFLQNCEK